MIVSCPFSSSPLAMSVDTYLASLASSAPGDVGPLYTRARELYDKRLWHQLTDVMEELVHHKDVKDLMGLYQNVIKDFESK